jgi:peptide deformylase
VSELRNEPRVLVNPEIISATGRAPAEEGCLSVPGIYDKVQRATQIRFRALDRHGQPYELDADGLLAVCVQHEVDHLDGLLFVDHLSELKRQLIRRRLEKERRQRSTAVHRASAPAL